MNEIAEYQRIFLSRLDTLGHILDVGQAHIPDFNAALQSRLAPDMFPLGTQVVFACNQARSFHQWCTGNKLDDIAPQVDSIEVARAHIDTARQLVTRIASGEHKLDETFVFRIGPDLDCELGGRQYVNDFLLPNFYFHIATGYAVLRMLGVPVGKADYMQFLLPFVRPAGK